MNKLLPVWCIHSACFRWTVGVKHSDLNINTWRWASRSSLFVLCVRVCACVWHVHVAMRARVGVCVCVHMHITSTSELSSNFYSFVFCFFRMQCLPQISWVLWFSMNVSLLNYWNYWIIWLWLLIIKFKLLQMTCRIIQFITAVFNILIVWIHVF